MKITGKCTFTVLAISLWALTFLTATAWSASLAAPKGTAKTQTLDRQKLSASMEALHRKNAADMKTKEARSIADFDAKRSAFISSQKGQVDANNAAAKIMVSQLKGKSQELIRIRNEATQMNSRYASASPAEKAKMDKRAGELMAELNKLGY